MRINFQFVARGLIAVLALLALGLVALARALPRMFPGPPSGPTPPVPAIAAPTAALPAGPVAFEEWAQYAGEPPTLSGSGFIFSLPDGGAVAATTAHSLTIGNPARMLERVAFGVAGDEGYLAEFDTLRGDPGSRFWYGADATVDYVLLDVASDVPEASILTPDARGGPQPGERVVLFSGRGAGQFDGTVQASGDRAAWAVMDTLFDAGLMSGSPFVSAHTGRVVGMAIARAIRGDRLYILMHPIGSLVEKALNADEYIKLSDY